VKHRSGKTSKNLRLIMLGAGLLVGALFPVFALFFVVAKSTSALLIFGGICVLAGLMMGWLCYVVASKLSENTLATVLRGAHDRLGLAVKTDADIDGLAQEADRLFAQVAGMMSQTRAVNDDIRALTADVLEATGQQASGAAQQAAAVTQTSATVEELAQTSKQIAENSQRVRLLRAEAARLEQPGRLETLSRGAALAPVKAERQVDENALPTLKPVHVPVVTPVSAAPAPAVAEPAGDAPAPPAAAAAAEAGR